MCGTALGIITAAVRFGKFQRQALRLASACHIHGAADKVFAVIDDGCCIQTGGKVVG